VASGLGEATPRHVIVAPISAEGRVNGVIELGFLDPAGDPELELCARVAETLGMALRSAFYRHERELLLEETQRQAEELEAQRADLRAINEELEEQGRSLREVNEHLAGKQAELEQHAAALEAQRRELLAAQETLARASRYKSEFLANMSHELRTPLNSALILARLLADDRDGNLTAEQVRFAETIHHAGLDLLALIEDVLDLSKIEAGRVEIQPEALRVESLVESLRRAFAPVAEEKKLAFRV